MPDEMLAGCQSLMLRIERKEQEPTVTNCRAQLLCLCADHSGHEYGQDVVVT